MYATNQSLVNFKAMTIYMWEALLAERGIYVEPKTKVLKMGVKKTRPRRHPLRIYWISSSNNFHSHLFVLEKPCHTPPSTTAATAHKNLSGKEESHKKWNVYCVFTRIKLESHSSSYSQSSTEHHPPPSSAWFYTRYKILCRSPWALCITPPLVVSTRKLDNLFGNEFNCTQ